jgi:hypothetical protein
MRAFLSVRDVGDDADAAPRAYAVLRVSQPRLAAGSVPSLRHLQTDHGAMRGWALVASSDKPGASFLLRVTRQDHEPSLPRLYLLRCGHLCERQGPQLACCECDPRDERGFACRICCAPVKS